ncbi:binding--dependent transport system inner membrane component family protein [Listeria fleischmannii 1991]|uniref:sn-glycerol-3-phosphate transport system permease protein ugpA n=5 Tax=Listeria fleischmannii TaxID=1069827 RepID=A0A2X3HM33_9LIST|nr:sugar ABC transporter permease [Listeria fleischmannii]EIA20596.1 binding-protein-dependent transport system membrane protein [Listeria fleischmannii subsp. coloradonensis]EUJ47867.1 binding--dependent transport system inner membrane component family protein [Listeria fleischmannii FSL S10-1203]KMT58665.1 binding--dependent transport system inner membrane component family protein [Listeria fleischmannii 1991]MBC1399151.1 sugar ABC transporter permease [Listeria fleischmannii]MBC1419186.1 su
MKKLGREFMRNKAFLAMCLPGFIWLIIFFYIPVLGNVVAFKDFHYAAGGFIESLKESPWVGFDNFKFLFSSDNAYLITRNTVLYNVAFIVLGLIVAVMIAIIMSELRSKKLIKVYQTSMLLPYFLSWVVISYFVYAFLSPDKGLLNSLIVANGGEAISWYTEPKYWPYILIFMGIWKGVGYNSIIYFATIMGIDPTYYEAAQMDGASKWQQVKNVTLPQLVPLITILSILAVGNIFRADFGLFYQIPRNSGALYEVTSVLDTYIYNGLTSTGDIGMAAAAGLYQSLVGFVLVVGTNLIVRKFDPESALF